MMLSAGNGFIMQSEKYSRDNAGQSLKKYILLKQGELAYNHGASKAKQYGCCYELTEKEARIPYVYHCFKISETEYTPYIAMALNNSKMDKQLKRLVSSSVRMDGLLNISFEDYMSVTLFVPSSKEQKHIADFINRLDERIKAQEKLVASLKKYKRGLLTYAFEEMTLSDDADSTTYHFSEIAQRRKEKYSPDSGVEYPCIELEHIEQGTGRLLGSVSSTTQSSIKTVARSGDVLFGKLRPYLRKFAFAEQNIVCSSEIWAFVPSEYVIPKYLYYLVQTEHFLRVANISSGTKMPRAEWANIEKEPFDIPCILIQEKTVSILEAIDKKICTSSDSLRMLMNFREGLLQQLFI